MSLYLQNSKGTFIPATKRPDGTWRKARRVKDGYVPQEEVPLYESKGKQFAQLQSDVPPGMCPFAAAESRKAREKQERIKAKKIENETVKNSKLLPPGALTRGSPPTPMMQINPATTDVVVSLATKLDDSLKIGENPEIDTAKQLKKLRKKIREIELIENKIKAGEIKNLDKDQLDKVKKKKELLEHINILEKNSVQPLA